MNYCFVELVAIVALAAVVVVVETCMAIDD